MTLRLNFFAEHYLVENRCQNNYDYFVDLVIQVKALYENFNISDVINMCELPYPLFNDIILKQIEDNKNTKKKLEELNNQKNPTNKVIRKRR